MIFIISHCVPNLVFQVFPMSIDSKKDDVVVHRFIKKSSVVADKSANETPIECMSFFSRSLVSGVNCDDCCLTAVPNAFKINFGDMNNDSVEVFVKDDTTIYYRFVPNYVGCSADTRFYIYRGKKQLVKLGNHLYRDVSDHPFMVYHIVPPIDLTKFTRTNLNKVFVFYGEWQTKSAVFKIID